VRAGREFQDAVREVLAANAQLLVLAKKQEQQQKKKKEENEWSTPRRLWNYVTRRLRLRSYFQDPGDGRQQPHSNGVKPSVETVLELAHMQSDLIRVSQVKGSVRSFTSEAVELFHPRDFVFNFSFKQKPS